MNVGAIPARAASGARFGLALVLAAAMVEIPSTGCAGPAGTAPALDADILLNDGPGVSATAFTVRGRILTATFPAGADGGAAGLFRIELAASDALLAELAKMPASVSGPPPMPGMPTVAFEVKQAGASRRLLGTRPPADPWVNRAMGLLGAWEKEARRHPLLTLSLEVAPVASGKPGAVLRLSATGSGEAHVDLAAVRLETGAAASAKPGTTPLPPVWKAAARAAAKPTPRVVTPGHPLEVTLDVPAPSPGSAVRAVYAGPAKLTVAGETRDLAIDLSSAPRR